MLNPSESKTLSKAGGEQISRRLLLAAPIAAFAAALADMAVFMFAKNALELPLLMASRPGATGLAPLGVGAVIAASVVPAVVATALFALLRRRSKRPLLVFSCMAVAVLLVSMLPVGTIAVDRPATRLVLGLMHVLDATVIVAIIAFISRPTRTKDARDLGRIVATTLLGLMYLPPSISKVLGTGKIADNFRAWGYPDWTIYMTGAIQLLGVVMLATRRSAPAGALLLAASAIESAFVNGTHGAGAMIAFPFLQLVFALAVAWLNRPRKQATELDLQSTP